MEGEGGLAAVGGEVAYHCEVIVGISLMECFCAQVIKERGVGVEDWAEGRV